MSRKVLTNYQFDVLQIIDDVIYVYFVAEMLIKMVSEGLIKSWNFQLLEPTDLIEKKSLFLREEGLYLTWLFLMNAFPSKTISFCECIALKQKNIKIALGVVGKGCYLQETWNKLDCFIVVSG